MSLSLRCCHKSIINFIICYKQINRKIVIEANGNTERERVEKKRKEKNEAINYGLKNYRKFCNWPKFLY